MLPRSKLPRQVLRDLGLGLDEVVFFGRVVAQIEQLSARLTSPFVDDHKLVAVVQNGPGAGKVLRGDLGVMEIAEVAEGTSKEGTEPNIIFRWRPRTDTWEKVSEPVRFYKDLNLHTGMTKEQIQKDNKKRQTILQWMIKNKIQDVVLFRRLNLMRSQYPFKKKFHTIFCRNVMIYFDVPTRQELIKKFSENLVDGGYLFIGHSESLGRTNQYFEYVKPAVYRKMANAE